MNTSTTRRRIALLLSTVLLSAAGAPAAAASVAPPAEVAPSAEGVAPEIAPDVAPPSDAWRGVTYRVLSRNGGLVGVGADEQTNTEDGDTSAQERLPLLCINVDERPVPPGVDLSSFDRWTNGEDRWAYGEVKLTPPVNGTALTSAMIANRVCSTEFGEPWRMVDLRDGSFTGTPVSGFLIANDTLNTDGRFWVINYDERANPWDSDGWTPETVIPDTTKVLGEADRAGLVEVRGDGSLVFAGTSPALGSLQVGDTIASLPTPAAPDGLLRKVTGITVEGEQTVVTTTIGLLQEAVTQGDLQAEIALTEADVDVARSGDLATQTETAQGAEGTEADATQAGIEFTFLSYSRNSFCLYDHRAKSLGCDAGSSGGLKARAAGLNEYLSLEGEVNAEATVFANSTIRTSGLYFDAGLELKEDAKLIIDGKGTYSFNKSKELTQWKKKYLPVAFHIGWFPVVLTPELVPTVGTSGRMDKTLHYEVGNEFESRQGVKFDRGWAPINYVKSDLGDTAVGTTGPADVSVHAGLKGSLYAYGSGNRVYAEPKAFAQGITSPFSQTPTPSYNICTFAGLRADVGADLPIIDKTWHSQVAESKKRIRCWRDGNPIPANLTKVVLRLSDISQRGVDVNKVLPDGSYQRIASNQGKGDLDITSYLNRGADTSIRVSCLSHRDGNWRHTCDLDVFGTDNGITSSMHNPGRRSCRTCGSKEEYKFTIRADGTVRVD